MEEVQFLYDKTADVMVAILQKNTSYSSKEPAYAKNIAREVDTTYSHATRMMSTLEEMEYIDREQRGRRKIIQLTPKGEEVAKAIQNLKNKLEKESMN